MELDFRWGEELPTSNYVRRFRWLLQTLGDFGEATRTIVKECMPPRKFLSYMVLMSSIINVQPSSFEEEVDQHVWWDSMVEEYTSIMRDDVWDIVLRPNENLFVSSRWLYKIKHVVDGFTDKFKVRFMVRGFSHKERVDYEDNFSLVAKYASIRAIISTISVTRWRIHQLDVKIDFLNGIIEEEVYIEKPRGFEVHGRESHVCSIKKSLYRLKQTSRAWYSMID
jgi:hypothetical protein